MSQSLPNFRSPPVVEMVLGVQFTPLPLFRNAHLGVFWKSLGLAWPNVVDAPPLPRVTETFDSSHPARAFELRFGLSDAQARIQIRNSAGDQLIQFQNGRFHLNWLAGVEGRSYPSFTTVHTEFDRHFSNLVGFLEREGMGPVTPDLWEITYVNHILKDGLWTSPTDWPRVVPRLLGRPDLPPPVRFEGCAGTWVFEIAPKKGRLQVELLHALTGKSADETLVLRLTARGPIPQGVPSLADGLNLGHETIVRAFADMTSKEAHEHWKRIQ
jgi:uncharacterized protein (TIGR04255 family)